MMHQLLLLEIDLSTLPVNNIVITLLLLLAALFMGSVAAGAEIAYFTLNAKEVNYLKTRRDNTSIQIIQLIEQPATLLSGIKSTKMVASIIIILSLLNLSYILLYPLFALWLCILIVVVFSFVLLLLIMDILPKMYARQHNLRMATFTAPFVQIFYRLFKNFIPTEGTLQEEREEDSHLKSQSNQEDLKDTVQLRLGREPSKEEVDIFKGILRFSEVMVKEVMQPRMSISGVRAEWNLNKVRAKILKSKFSRMPVYKDTIDNIIGVIYSKDLIKYINQEEADWHELMRPVFYVHERKLIEDLFQEFQVRRTHQAIVVDEFGGTSGLVSMEDIMEEVVGEIRDEFDEDVLNFKKIDDHSYIFEGKILINEFCRILGVDYHTFDAIKGDSSSLAGLVLELAKKFPTANEIFTYNQFEFTVLGIEQYLIERVLVKILPN